MPKLDKDYYRLIRTVETKKHDGTSTDGMVVRIEILQSVQHANRYRFWFIGLQRFQVTPDYHDGPLGHEIYTTLSLPNLGTEEFYTAKTSDEAEAIALKLVDER